MAGVYSISEDELPHTVEVRHRSTDGTQGDYGEYQYTEVDTEHPCRFEWQEFAKVSHRTKDQEFVPQYDLVLYMLPNANIKKTDQIVTIEAENGELVYEEDENNPLMVEQVDKLPGDRGIHHLEVYCVFRNVNT